MKAIRITHAHLHNLKNISLEIPRQQLVAITGVSGSGKSTLAFDLVYELGRRRYLQSIGMFTDLVEESRLRAHHRAGARRSPSSRASSARATRAPAWAPVPAFLPLCACFMYMRAARRVRPAARRRRIAIPARSAGRQRLACKRVFFQQFVARACACAARGTARSTN